MTISHNGAEIPTEVPPIISLIGLLERVADNEWTAIEMAALDDPAGTTPNRRAAARIRVKLRRIVASGSRGIDLRKNWVGNFFTLMETSGHLDAGRAAQIVNPVLSPEEINS